LALAISVRMIILAALSTANSILAIGETELILDDTIALKEGELIFALDAFDSFVGEAVGVYFNAESLICNCKATLALEAIFLGVNCAILDQAVVVDE